MADVDDGDASFFQPANQREFGHVSTRQELVGSSSTRIALHPTAPTRSDLDQLLGGD
ncbi:MAG: hypothetical protein U1F61_20075 [Opitutaceae bacterium]